MSFEKEKGLLSVWDNDSNKYKLFPYEYMYKESYSVTPNRRQDLDSTRNANGVLTRNVVSNEPSTIVIKTPPMENSKVAEMMSFITKKYTVAKQRKLKLRYYCPDLDSYQEGEFYLADVEFPIMRVDVDKSKIFYNSITLDFVEY